MNMECYACGQKPGLRPKKILEEGEFKDGACWGICKVCGLVICSGHGRRKQNCASSPLKTHCARCTFKQHCYCSDVTFARVLTSYPNVFRRTGSMGRTPAPLHLQRG